VKRVSPVVKFKRRSKEDLAGGNARHNLDFIYVFANKCMNCKALTHRYPLARLTALIVALAILSLIALVRTTSADNAEFNRRATATAQILAGITPNPSDPELKRLVESDTFKEHQQGMASSWSQVRGRIQTMEAWRSQEIKIPGAQKKLCSTHLAGPTFSTLIPFFQIMDDMSFFASSGREGCRIWSR
jgi:hypothetical protein